MKDRLDPVESSETLPLPLGIQAQLRFCYAEDKVTVCVGRLERPYACHWLHDDTPMWSPCNSMRSLVWSLLAAHTAHLIPAVCGLRATAGGPALQSELAAAGAVQSLAHRLGVHCMAIEGAAGVAAGAGAVARLGHYVHGAAGLGSWLVCSRLTNMPSAMLSVLSELAQAMAMRLRARSGGGGAFIDAPLRESFLLVPVLEDVGALDELPLCLRAQLRPLASHLLSQKK